MLLLLVILFRPAGLISLIVSERERVGSFGRPPKEGRCMALLEAAGIIKIFGKLTALNGAELTVAENEFHGLIGPNGSGKSTLMKCVAGAEIADQRARSRFVGRDITQATPAERARAGMSLKFQITSVLPTLTLYDNILLALQAQTSLPELVFSRTRGVLHDRVMAMLEQFRLVDRADGSGLGAVARPAAMARDRDGAGAGAEAAAAGRADRRHEPGGAARHRRTVAADQARCSLVIVEHDLDFIRDICDRLTVLDQGSVLDPARSSRSSRAPKVQEVYLRRA